MSSHTAIDYLGIDIEEEGKETESNKQKNSFTEIDVNLYQQKKTIAKGLMDFALFSANANQLRYLLEKAHSNHPYYYPGLTLIIGSLIFQIIVGILLILNSTYNINKKLDLQRANKINNIVVVGIFLVTVINVFISAFGVVITDKTEENSIHEASGKSDATTLAF